VYVWGRFQTAAGLRPPGPAAVIPLECRPPL